MPNFIKACLLLYPVCLLFSPLLGSTDSYHKLKNDSYDFSFLEQIKSFLVPPERQSLRPASCPLKQEKHIDLVEKLNGLYEALQNSKCKDYQDSFLKSFGATLSKFGQSYNTIPPEDNLSDSQFTDVVNQQVFYGNLSELLGSLSSLTNDAQCALDIKTRGFIPVMTDVVGAASATTMYSANKYAFAAGATGLVMSSTVKILAGLLEPKFDMNKQEDRENFINIVCTFYDIRTEIKNTQFLRIPHQKDFLHQKLIDDYLFSLQSKIDFLQKEQSRNIETLNLSKYSPKPNAKGFWHFAPNPKKSFAQENENLKKVSSLFEEKLIVLNTLKGKLETEKTNYKNLLDRQNFLNDDDGTHYDHLIIKEVKKIQGKLFGHEGWRFFEYVRDNSAQEIKKFALGMDAFKAKYSQKNSWIKVNSENQKKRACATVYDLLLSINNSKSLINMAADYIYSNREFFHENVPWLDIHFYILPTGISIKRQFLRQASLLIKAKEELSLKEPQKISPKFYSSLFLFPPNMDELMFAQVFLEKNIHKLYEFSDLNQCEYFD